MKLLLISAISFTFYMSLAQPAAWNSRGVGGGGGLFSPSINPANNNEYYIACDMSELFHTTDFGLTYSQLNFSQFVGGHNSKMCFTSTANLLYNISYPGPAHVAIPVKSTDNGVTWTLLAGNPNPASDIWTMHVDYNNPSRIIISSHGNIYFSNDGGTTFTSIHTAVNATAGNIVGGVFFDGNNIYVGTNDGVLVSTTGGTSWNTAAITGIPAAEAIFSFTGAKVGTTTRFFCLTGTAANMYVGLQGNNFSGFMAGVYSCDYGTSQWTAKTTGITLGTDYPMYVDMAENDTTTAYLAGSSSSFYPNIMKTTNAGGSWTLVFNTNNNLNITTGWCGYQGDMNWNWGVTSLGFDVAANNKDEVIFGDFGFCHKTNDGGLTWTQAYTAAANQHPANSPTPKKQNYNSIGMENTSCWQVLWTNANTMWASYTDIGGIRSIDGGNRWSFNYTGNLANTTYRVARGANGTLYGGTSNIHDMYQTSRLSDAQLDVADANGNIVYSTDNGFTWLPLHSFGHPVFWVVLDPNNATRAYASVINHAGTGTAGGVYRCNDLNNLATSTWTLLPAPPRTEGHPACLVVLNDGKLVATFSGRIATNFTQSSGCFIYDPLANSWTDVSDAGMNYWTKDIVVDPNDVSQNTWYVGVFSGCGGVPNGLGGLYKTTKRGISWTKLTGSILNRVNSCTFNPGNANEIYLTTESQGLWMSSNINSATPVFSNVSNYPFQMPTRVFFNPNNTTEIWVTSFGNGMKMGMLGANGIRQLLRIPTEFYLEQNFSNPFNPTTHFQFAIADFQFVSLKIYDVLGREIETLVSEKMSPGRYAVEWNASSFPSGVYFYRLDAGSFSETKKLLLMK
ncbi:MAG: T9SS type A sorting domain-containing protein [Ignavibacteriales bacterium]|nr:T9SS type A sorting domain-containing protein [Ignavibacteriales bacterium]